MVLAVLAVPILVLCPTLQASDFPFYYKTAQLFLAGRGAETYAVNLAIGRMGSGLNEPPFLLWAIAPLSLFSLLEARLVFTIIMLIVLAAATVVMANAAKLSNRKTLLLIGLVAASGPVLEICKISKPSPLLYLGLACCVYYLRKGQEMKAGAWAVLCFIKPQEIVPLFVFALGCGRYRFIGAGVAVVVLLVVLTFPLVGVEGYVNYVHKLQFLNQNLKFSGTQFMPIVAGQLVRLQCMPEQLAMKIGGILYALGLVGVFFLARTRRNQTDWWKDGVIIAPGAICVIFPYILAYDLVILIPSLCFLLEKILQTKPEEPVSVEAEAIEENSVDSASGAVPQESIVKALLSSIKVFSSLPLMQKSLFICTCISIVTFMSPLYGYIHYYIHWPLNLHFCALLLLSVVSIIAVGIRSPKGARLSSRSS